MTKLRTLALASALALAGLGASAAQWFDSTGWGPSQTGWETLGGIFNRL